MNHVYNILILLAKSSKYEAPAGPGDKSLSLSWAIVIFLTLLGLAVTLTPARRTTEVKRPHED